jgi:crossover junction endodeoxyribonuclease RusA
VAQNAMQAHGCGVITGAVMVEAEFVLPRPKSTPKRRTPLATRRPDADKLLRAILDAITNVVIADDALAVDLRATKRLAEIGESPGARITVTPKGEERSRG